MQVPVRNRSKQVVAHALVSSTDYNTVMTMHTLSVSSEGYVRDNTCCLLSHRILGKPAEGFVVDHINGNKLDNTRDNLRFATFAQNAQNRSKKIGASSQYIGVSWNASNSKWLVVCGHQYLGKYDKEEDAACAYDGAALHIYGPGAKTNGLVTVPVPLERPKRSLPKGVSMKGKMYFARLMNKHIGAFTTAFAARAAYEDALWTHQYNKLEALYAQPINRNTDGVAVIPVSDTFALVDDEMYHKMLQYKWYTTKKGYASRGSNRGSWESMMHRLIMSAKLVDHINQNKLDNRKANLRPATNSDNGQNRAPFGGKQYKGVYPSKYYSIHQIVTP